MVYGRRFPLQLGVVLVFLFIFPSNFLIVKSHLIRHLLKIELLVIWSIISVWRALLWIYNIMEYIWNKIVELLLINILIHYDVLRKMCNSKTAKTLSESSSVSPFLLISRNVNLYNSQLSSKKWLRKVTTSLLTWRFFVYLFFVQLSFHFFDIENLCIV